MEALYDVVSVKAEKDFRLKLVFEDGLERTFDMAPYLNEKTFCKLKNKSLFREAKVGYGTVIWPGGIDIAPETLRGE
jgi:hypothetical protein